MIALLDKALKAFLIFLVIFMIATVVWQVFSRYVLHAPSSLTEEIARFQLIWLGLGGAVFTFRNRMHVSIDTMVAKFTGRKKTAIAMFSLAMTMLFAAVILVYGGARLVALTATLKQTSAALGISMAYIYSIIPISGVLIIIYSGYFMVETLSGRTVPPLGQFKAEGDAS
jgi:TRAP-type C4-dicarboxylate transport system permease small subunit